MYHNEEWKWCFVLDFVWYFATNIGRRWYGGRRLSTLAYFDLGPPLSKPTSRGLSPYRLAILNFFSLKFDLADFDHRDDPLATHRRAMFVKTLVLLSMSAYALALVPFIDGGKGMPALYNGWLNEQIAKQARTAVGKAVAAGKKKIEVNFPPVPNVDE